MADYRSDNHRVDFKTCPNCGHKMSYEDWDKCSTSMTTQVIFGKTQSAAITSQCLQCGSESWVHEELTKINRWSDYPKSWVSRATKVLAKRKRKALYDWGNGICWKCANLESAELHTTARRSCLIGLGKAELECDSFVEITL